MLSVYLSPDKEKLPWRGWGRMTGLQCPELFHRLVYLQKLNRTMLI
jgi:hypothetical protein